MAGDTSTSAWTCDRCGATLDPSEPAVWLGGARYCLSCSPARQQVPRIWPVPRPEILADALPGRVHRDLGPPRRLRALTPEQEAALAAWRAEDAAGRADLLDHLREWAAAEERAAASPDCDDPDLSRSADDCRDSARRYAAAAAMLRAFGGDDA